MTSARALARPTNTFRREMTLNFPHSILKYWRMARFIQTGFCVVVVSLSSACGWRANQRVTHIDLGPRATPIQRYEEETLPQAPVVSGYQTALQPINPGPTSGAIPVDQFESGYTSNYPTESTNSVVPANQVDSQTFPTDPTAMIQIAGVTFDPITGMVVARAGATAAEIENGLRQLYQAGYLDAESYYQETARLSR